METIMKIQTKIAALLLTLPMAFASNTDDFTASGTSADENTIVLTSDSATIFTTAGGFDGSNALAGTVNNSNDGGWKITAVGSNGTFKHPDGNLDGHKLDYSVGCDAIGGADATSGVLTSTENTISTDASPVARLHDTAFACHLTASESVDELFDGTFTEVITLTSSDL